MPPDGQLIVQFNTPLAADEHRRLGALLTDRPEVALRAYAGPGMPEDLDFLEHYPCLGHLQIDLLRLRSLDGLRVSRTPSRPLPSARPLRARCR